MNWLRISSGIIIGSSALGTSGIQLWRYRLTPFSRMPSTCVNVQLIRASASVTDSVDVAAKMASVGTSTPAISTFSSESGSGMKPSMFRTQTKMSSEAT